MKNIFITGATGYIGRYLLKQLDTGNYDTIYCLSRSENLPELKLKASGNIKFIVGSLLDTDAYSSCLSQCDTVIHLAALTGKGDPSEYFNVNTNGTNILVRECERLKIKKILFVSTIAVNFPHISRYHYAQSKKQAEDIVINSKMSYSIVRPTIVISHDGAIWNKISKLAKAYFPVVLGTGNVKVQPIHVRDLSNILADITKEDSFKNEIYELGGPDAVSFKEFICSIHHEYNNKNGFVVHLPINAIFKIISIIEKASYSILPFNSGQLYPFLYNSLASTNPITKKYSDKMMSSEKMIHHSVKKERIALIDQKLSKECRVLCRYLINEEPNEYVISKYIDAIKIKDWVKNKSSFNSFLDWFGTKNKWFAKLADIYSRYFCGYTIFRKKLILTLAILESKHPYSAYYDSIDYENKYKLFCTMALKFLAMLSCAILSIVILSPVQLGYKLYIKRNPKKN